VTHIGFTGTRDGLTWHQQSTLDEILQLRGSVFHHGDCVGADSDAHDVAWRYDKRIVIHPPSDDRLRAHRLTDHGEYREPKPYLDRNRDIVDESDLLIACPRETSEQAKGGTWYTVRYARNQGKPVTIVWPDGTHQDDYQAS